MSIERADDNELPEIDDKLFSYSEIRFYHAVNSKAILAQALNSDVNFIESDIIVDIKNKDEYVAVLGHDPGKESNLNFDELVTLCSNSEKGLKVDIKEWNAISSVLTTLQEHTSGILDDMKKRWIFVRHDLKHPYFLSRPGLIINADVLTGTTTPKHVGCRFNKLGKVLSSNEQIQAAQEFIEIVLQHIPDAILSLGWTTAGEHRSYSTWMVQEMLQVLKPYVDLGIIFTIAVRASYVRESWSQLLRLLELPTVGLTIWSNVELPREELDWLKIHVASSSSKIMFDLPTPDSVSSWAYHRSRYVALHSLRWILGEGVHQLTG
jgi:Uncharacterized conserved protein (DUF2181)